MKHTSIILLVVLAIAGPLPLRAGSQTSEGVTAKDVRFYSEGIECYGKIFMPKDFSAESKTPGVVLAPDRGETATSVEKYAARFASRGLVAMIIDYRGWGKSGGFLQTVDQVKTDDRLRFSQMTAKVRIRRKRLIPNAQVLDIRNALYYLQGEAGVDRARVGVWGVDMAGGHAVVIAAVDARVKAIVAQVGAVGGLNASGPVAIPPPMLEDGIKRARTGQGAEVDGGFSFKSKIDMWSGQVNREFRPGAMLDRIPLTTKILWIPAEKDELIPPHGAVGPYNGAKAFKGTSQVAEVPYLTHFQIYSYAGFEVSSTLAADWFLKYLGTGGAE